MILEGIVTTVDPEGVVNVAPMGPRVDAAMKKLLLRPFKTSQTYQNLKVHGEGVFHVTDDVLLLAQSAVGQPDPPPMLIPATRVHGHILQESCRFYEFRVTRLDDADKRTTIEARVLASGRLRDFFGFNRAKHAVVEAAILATRVHLLPRADILVEFGKLALLVEKTGGKAEHEAFKHLHDYVLSAAKQGDSDQTQGHGS
jgi:uncharacterized protein